MAKELDVLAAARAAAETLKATATAQVRRHAELVKERAAVEDANLPQAEILSHATRLVDEVAQDFAKTYAPRFAWDLSGGKRVIEGSTRYQDTKPHLPGNFGQDGLTFRDLCGLAPSLVKARIAEIIRGSGETYGLPAAARARRVAEIDAEIQALEAQHVELLDGATEHGFSVEEIPSVRDRRVAAERKAEREEEDAQYQRAEALRQAEARGDRAEVARLTPLVAADRKTEISRRIRMSPRPTPSVSITRTA
jgi:hypothetical protein